MHTHTDLNTYIDTYIHTSTCTYIHIFNHNASPAGALSHYSNNRKVFQEDKENPTALERQGGALGFGGEGLGGPRPTYIVTGGGELKKKHANSK